MIYNHVELHNVSEVLPIEGKEGVLLQRVPEKVRLALHEKSQIMFRRAAGMEIRFVSEGWRPVQAKLVSYNGPVQAYFYMGDYAVGTYEIGTEPTIITLELPETSLLRQLPRERGDGSFAPHVWRILLQEGEVHWLGLEAEDDIRPPREDELPRLRYLAYGTSITQGYLATHPLNTYVKQAAWRLRADAINLGSAGAAYCEPALGDYIASRNDWDFASLCISVNLYGQGTSAVEFGQLAEYMVRKMAEAHRNKPIFCISLLPSFNDNGWRRPDSIYQAHTPDEYRGVLREIVSHLASSNVHYIDGRDLLASFYGLTHDLVHPSDQGMIEIGEKLAAIVKPRLLP